MPEDRALVRCEAFDGVATITLDSVSNRNALSARLVGQLLELLAEVTIADEIHCVVITGAGTVFCSGADLTDPPSNAGGSRFSYPDVLQAILACPKPVIARVNGHARAGGLGIIAACDIAIAPQDATFAFSEVRIGVVPAIISVVCRRVMSQRALTRYALTGESFDSAAAVEAGLITITVPGDVLAPTFGALLAGIHRTEPNAVARTKLLLRQLTELPIDEAFPIAAAVSAEFFGSAQAAEGIAAFREKRTPSWAW